MPYYPVPIFGYPQIRIPGPKVCHQSCIVSCPPVIIDPSFQNEAGASMFDANNTVQALATNIYARKSAKEREK
jgi:hypothetical protein